MKNRMLLSNRLFHLILVSILTIGLALVFTGCGDTPSSGESEPQEIGPVAIGDSVTYGDYEVTLKSVRASNEAVKEEGKTFIYLTFDVKNTTNDKIMSNSFKQGATLSTADGMQIDSLEITEKPVYKEELKACWIEASKYVTGEIAFKVDEALTDYRFTVDFLTIKEDTEIAIPASAITVDEVNYQEPAIMGEPIVYGDFEVTIQSARANKEGAAEDKTRLYIMMDVKNITGDTIMSNPALKPALSTVDGKQIEVLSALTDKPAYTQELEACWIDADKFISGEVAFEVDETLTDYLYCFDFITVDNDREILIPASAITVED